ncbi:MAG: FAD-dependent oxidoreductase [Phycisphaerae bacterium]|nr:FAD-dependent oxidoreductase [Phycisphaerae bacterium]
MSNARTRSYPLFLAVTLCALSLCATAATVLIEAESLADLGGWVVDTQAIDQVGSPYIMAHGLGAPVAPGRFHVLIDNKPLPAAFGTQRPDWHWQSGGKVALSRKQFRLALRDLTGFNGRCDAVLLTTDANLRPPDNGPELTALRRKLLNLTEVEDAGRYDLVVVGGGMAGTCTAISAARLGLTVALIHDRPLLGGNNSSEVRVHLNGEINLPPYPALGDVVRELDGGFRGNAQPATHYDDEKKLRVTRAEKNLTLFLNTYANEVQTRDDRITVVIALDVPTGRRLRFTAPLFVDCTGDGTIGYLAGADYRMGRESQTETGESLAPQEPDKMTMGMSVQWYSAETSEPAPFPDCPWAMQFTEANCQPVLRGDWDWETGMNRNQVTESEFVRDHGLRVVFGNWAFMKNHSTQKAKFANRKLDWVAHVGGKRESRRLMGDLILCQQDIQQMTIFPDAFVTATWSIDLHYPNPQNTKHFPGQEFRSYAEFGKKDNYPVPYRCLYSRNIPNLMMAGRNISVTHVALGTTRVMRTCGMMGELLGMAASLCKQHNTTPRGVYENHLEELKALATKGVGKTPREPIAATPPEWLKDAGPNLAPSAQVKVSSTLDPKYKPAHINDGKIDLRNNDARWVSDRSMPQWIEFTWPEPQTINAARIVSGWSQSPNRAPADVITDFAFQYENDGWKEVPKSKTTANNRHDCTATFEPIQTKTLRLNITAAAGETARIFEVALYNTQGPPTH